MKCKWYLSRNWRFVQRYSFFYSSFSIAVDQVLWHVCGLFYYFVLWQISIPSYDLLPLTGVAEKLYRMINSILPCWTSFISALTNFVNNFCGVLVLDVRWCGLFSVLNHIVLRRHTAQSKRCVVQRYWVRYSVLIGCSSLRCHQDDCMWPNCVRE